MLLKLGIGFIIGVVYYFLYRLYKLTTIENKYSNFRLKNLIAISNARIESAEKLSGLISLIELYKKNQINYFEEDDIDFKAIKNLRDFLVAYNNHLQNYIKAKKDYENLCSIINKDYNSLQGKYSRNLLDSYYKELQAELESFRIGIIDLYEQSSSFLDTIKSIYETILRDRIILGSMMQNAINREDYLEAAELRDLLKQIN